MPFKYTYNSINERYENTGHFIMHNTEERTMNLIKCKVAHQCNYCKEHIPSKSYCLGTGYVRVCLKCMPIFLNNMLNSFKDYQDKCEILLKNIANKEQEMIKNNILAKMEDKSTNHKS